MYAEGKADTLQKELLIICKWIRLQCVHNAVHVLFCKLQGSHLKLFNVGWACTMCHMSISGTLKLCVTERLFFVVSCDKTYCEQCWEFRNTYLVYDSGVEHPFPRDLQILVSSTCTVPYSFSVMNTLFNSTTREITIR